MTLDELPSFTIEAISDPESGPRLSGRFSHLGGVREGRSWLYVPLNALIGDLEDLDPATNRGVFAAPFWSPTGPGQIGQSLPWLDGYWQAYHVTMILDPANHWTRTQFVPSDAQHFDLNGVHGWQPIGAPLPDDASPRHVAPGGWDHEHCELCAAKVGAQGAPFGYLDDAGRWLCESCFHQYALPRDLSFLAAT